MRVTKILAAASFLFFGVQTANAQSLMSLERDLQNLREDVQAMQRKSYQEESSMTLAPGSAKEMVLSVGQMEEQMREFAGKFEELDYKIKQLDERITMLNKDIDVRMSMLEGKPVSGMGTQAPQNVQRFEAPVAVGAPQSLVGDSVSSSEDLPSLKGLTVQETYNAGLEELKNAQYDAAEASFNTILTKYPDDSLAGNAQYWLGETYYVKKDYTKAAVAFAKGYSGYKSGSKGPDSLLKLGMSMEGLGKKTEACAAYVSMDKEFPQAPDAVKQKAKEHAGKLDCDGKKAAAAAAAAKPKTAAPAAAAPKKPVNGTKNNAKK